VPWERWVALARVLALANRLGLVPWRFGRLVPSAKWLDPPLADDDCQGNLRQHEQYVKCRKVRLTEELTAWDGRCV